MSTRGHSIADSSAVRGLPAAVVVVALVVVAHHGGVSYGDIGLYALRIVVAVLLPGVLLSRLIRSGKRTGVEDLAVGFAVGTLVQLPVWWLFLELGLTYWLWPAIVVGVVAAWPAAHRRVLTTELEASPLAWSAAVAAICLVALAWLRSDFLRWTPIEPGGAYNYYGDMVFHLSVAGNAKYAVPPTLPQVSGEPLYYHWFAYLDMGVASRMTGIELATILFQLWIPVALLAGVVITAACATRISGRLWAGPLAALLIYGTGEIVMTAWVSRPFTPMTQHAMWSSPTQTFAIILAIPAVGVAIDYVRKQAGSTRQLWLLGVPLFIGLGLAKSAELPVLMGGVGVLLVTALLRRERPVALRAAVVGASMTASFVFSVLAFYGHKSGGVALDPLFTMRQYARTYINVGMDPFPGANTTTAVLAVTAVIGVWLVTVLGRTWGILLVVRRWRTADPGQVMLTGSLLAGTGAYFIFFHPGGSQVFFIISAFPLGAVASAWAICDIAPRLERRTALTIALLTATAGGLAYASKDLLGTSRPTDGFFNQVIFFSLPVIIFVLISAVLVGGVLFAHRHGHLDQVSAVTVITALFIAGGLTTTIQYVRSPEGTSVARTWAERGDRPGSVTDKGVTGARWLRNHSPHDAVLAANRHCFSSQRFPGPGPVSACDTASFWISAWTERSVLVEGWAYGYQAVAGELENGVRYRRQPFWDQALLAANDGFFKEPTAGGAAILCDRGATFALLDRRFQPDLPSLEPVAKQVYANSDVEIYRLPC